MYLIPVYAIPLIRVRFAAMESKHIGMYYVHLVSFFMPSVCCLQVGCPRMQSDWWKATLYPFSLISTVMFTSPHQD